MGSRAESIIPVLGPADAQRGETSCIGVPTALFPSQVAPPCGCPGVPAATPSTPGGPVPRAGRAAPCQLAQPASPAGSGPAPACLLPRLPGRSPLRALLPVPCGAARGMDGAG